MQRRVRSGGATRWRPRCTGPAASTYARAAPDPPGTSVPPCTPRRCTPRPWPGCCGGWTRSSDTRRSWTWSTSGRAGGAAGRGARRAGAGDGRAGAPVRRGTGGPARRARPADPLGPGRAGEDDGPALRQRMAGQRAAGGRRGRALRAGRPGRYGEPGRPAGRPGPGLAGPVVARRRPCRDRPGPRRGLGGRRGISGAGSGGRGGLRPHPGRAAPVRHPDGLPGWPGGPAGPGRLLRRHRPRGPGLLRGARGGPADPARGPGRARRLGRPAPAGPGLGGPGGLRTGPVLGR